MSDRIHTKPRIGLMAVGLGTYWSQFPHMKDGVLEAHSRLAKLFDGKGELVGAGLVDSVATARKAGERFVSSQIDIIFCHLTTYANSETLVPVVSDLDVPIVLLNVQPVAALEMEKVSTIADWLGVACTCAGLPEMTAVLLRLGKRFATVTGHLENDEILEEQIRLWCAIAGLRRRLTTQSIALLGRPFPGMLDLNLDETHFFKRFGTFIHHLNWDDVIEEFSNVTDANRQAMIARLNEHFSYPSPLSKSELNGVATVCSAFSRFVDRYNLCGVASHYEGAADGKRAQLLAAVNPALSLLMADGVACPVEGDIKAGLAMLILKSIAGVATLAELYSMDFNDDICIIGHSGAGDPAISSRKPSLSASTVFHGKSGKGYLTQFFPRNGAATLLAVTQDGRGEYRMIAAEGEVENGPALGLGDTNCRVRFSCGLRNFVDWWSSHGPTHHGVLGFGRQADSLSLVSKALGIPLEVICR